jgi:hypothetical protein
MWLSLTSPPLLGDKPIGYDCGFTIYTEYELT